MNKHCICDYLLVSGEIILRFSKLKTWKHIAWKKREETGFHLLVEYDLKALWYHKIRTTLND
jgi:hypothetical protein